MQKSTGTMLKFDRSDPAEQVTLESLEAEQAGGAVTEE